MGAAGADEDVVDYRFTLANERTFLAWIRTALGLDAAGLAVVQLLPELPVPRARELLGVALVLLGTAVTVTSLRRWAAVDRAMRADGPLPTTRMPALLAGAIGLVSVVGVLLLAAAQLRP